MLPVPVFETYAKRPEFGTTTQHAVPSSFPTGPSIGSSAQSGDKPYELAEDVIVPNPSKISETTTWPRLSNPKPYGIRPLDGKRPRCLAYPSPCTAYVSIRFVAFDVTTK